MSALLIIKKSIVMITSGLTLANKKLFFKKSYLTILIRYEKDRNYYFIGL